MAQLKEYEKEFRRYFKGGVADLRASVESAPRAVGALNAMIAQFPKGTASRKKIRSKRRGKGIAAQPAGANLDRS